VATINAFIQRLVGDISESESIVTIGNSPNHIKWLTGHIAFTTVFSSSILGGEMTMPDGWMEIFRRGADSPAGQPIFPPMPEVVAYLKDVQGKQLALIESADEQSLLTERQIFAKWNETPLNALLFFTSHNFYHGGQVAMIRRRLGRERSFG
jgi:hypothetical protein